MDAEDPKIISAEEVKTIAKRRLKLADSLKKGYATVYNQCSQEVKDKLEGTGDWESTKRDQLLHDLINKIERICVGFDDHKQEVFNLVQALKTLFLYLQSNKRLWSSTAKTSIHSGTWWRPLEGLQAYTRS
jgi:hypothetical protein